MEDRRFTDTEIPMFSGMEEGWYKHIHIVRAIIKSNGWSEETAALQLFVHLKGEALDVALLLKKKVRDTWTGLVQGLEAYYLSPSRLAGMRRQFAGAFRHPGLDPATFATDLGMLAIQGFGDMKEQARDTMIRDKFIDGQEQCALRRQLDGFAPGTPIGEIVDSCRIWESHSDPVQDTMKQIVPESDSQSSDSRIWERNRVASVVDNKEPINTEGVGIDWTMFFNELLGKLILRDGAKEQSEDAGNESGFEGMGQSLEPWRNKVSLTQGGVLPHTETEGFLGKCREWLKDMTKWRWIVRNSQNWYHEIQPVNASDQTNPVTKEGGIHTMDTQSRLPGLWSRGCGRQSAVRLGVKETRMFGRGLFRVP